MTVGLEPVFRNLIRRLCKAAGLEPGLAALCLLGQVRNRRPASLPLAWLVAHYASASLHLPLAALNSTPHDVNKFTSWDTGERPGHEHSEKPTR